MEVKKRISKEKRRDILSILKQSAENYRETNQILDRILPDVSPTKSLINR